MKHMKTSALNVQIQFSGQRGRKPQMKIVFTDKVAKQLYKRLHNRYGEK
jgi:hypothetical protein